MNPLLIGLLLLVVGIVLGGLELLIPSGGVITVLAVASVVAAIVVAFTGGLVSGAILLAVTAILVPILLAVVVRIWPYTPIGRRVLLRPPKPDEVLPDAPPYRELKDLIGKRGRAKHNMLPSGIILINGREYDAVSVGMPISAGQWVEVVGLQANHIVVRPAEGPKEQPSEAAQDPLAQPLDALGIEPLDDPLA